MESHGLRLVRDLLTLHLRAAVAIIDPASELGDARRLLSEAGIDIEDHTVLRGTAVAEFVAPNDAWMLGGVVANARDHGRARRTVHLRDGREAALHLIRVDELHLPTGFVMVLVPEAGAEFAETPLPSVVAAPARVGVVEVDGSGTVTRADDDVLSLLNRTRAEIEGSSVMTLPHPDDQEAAIVHWVAAKEQRGVTHRWRSRVVRGDGSVLWTEVGITNRINDAGDGGVRVEINDVSREVAASEALAAERSLLKELTETLPVGVAKFNSEGVLEYANAQLAMLLGGDPAVVVAGAIAGEIPALAEPFARLLGEARSSRFVSERLPERPERDLEWTLRPLTAADGTVIGGVLCVADVTEAIELRAALEERATTDALTGCLNWIGTINYLQAALRSASPGAGVGLLFIDLNGFKEINDRHGHAVGDRVLELVAARLGDAVRPVDKIGRIGGDEFVVVAPGLASLDATRVLATRVSTEFDTIANVADLDIVISASVGVGWAASGDADELMAEADRAMYREKFGAPDSQGGGVVLPR